jgi:ABC-type dipeptide/oligopeptide/nickel transport system permease subunit
MKVQGSFCGARRWKEKVSGTFFDVRGQTLSVRGKEFIEAARAGEAHDVEFADHH